jgi:hypothetical protein
MTTTIYHNPNCETFHALEVTPLARLRVVPAGFARDFANMTNLPI